MMAVHIRRQWEDRLLLLCTLVAFFVAMVMAKPQVFTLAQLQGMEFSELQQRFGRPDLQSMEEMLRWYAACVRLPMAIGGSSTAIILAAVLGAYLVGGCLKRPMIAELYAGTSRVSIALGLYGAVLVLGLAWSLLLYAGSLALYARDCFAVLGAEAWRIAASLLGWRMFFDLAAFCPVTLLAFVTREMHFSLGGGAMLAVLTTMLQLLREELWWLPNYALRSVVLSQPPMAALLSLVWPSALLLVLTPIVGVLVVWRVECR